MREQIEVIYESGVLRPLGPLPTALRDGERCIVTVERATGRDVRLDTICIAAAARDANPAVSLEDVRMILARAPGTGAEAIATEREDRPTTGGADEGT